MSQSYYSYEEPNLIQILTLISFFALLGAARKSFNKFLNAGLVGQILVGIIFGRPLANILDASWEATFLALGYLGLIGIVFEGGLHAQLDLLFRNLWLSAISALIGIVVPIGLSFLYIHLALGYSLIEAFVAGAALSATSLGTTFAIIKQSSIDLNHTRVGAVLLSAAVIDDVVALVMSRVIQSLRTQQLALAIVIVRPVAAAFGLAMISIPMAIILQLLWPRLLRSTKGYRVLSGRDDLLNCCGMLFLLLGWITIASYAGTSVLLGAYLAGLILSQLDSKPFNQTRFSATFGAKIADVQRLVFEAVFFASIGYCVPFLDMWTGRLIWRGVLYSLLMFMSKMLVGLMPVLINRTQVWPGIVLGSGMVARGEIGLLIAQIGINSSGTLSEDVFVIAIWAILLNTIIGPVAVSLVLKYRGRSINDGPWGSHVASAD